MRLDDVVNLLGSHRDYLILALSVLVLVEGGIIVLWARRAVRLRSDLREVAAAAESAKVAAERAAEQVVAKREVYSVAARTAVEPVEALRETPAPAAAGTPTPSPAATSVPVPAAAGPAVPTVAPAAAPAPAPAPAEEPAEFVTPAAQQAAAWVLPEVAASNGSGSGGGNGHHATSAEPGPTTLGWPEAPVPVEPAADFQVVSERAAPKAPEPPAAPPAGAPSLTVLEGTRTWSFPAAASAPSAQQPAPVPTHFDPAMFDTNDDILDDLPVTGDILLVEDDATIAKLYRVLLESRGYTVRHAADGLEGLDRANEKRPDLVLLDIMMPRMNGIAFLQALRSGEMRDVPVVVLSNFMEKQLVDDAMSLGALEYMVKAQTRPEALVGALPHWLRGERAFSY